MGTSPRRVDAPERGSVRRHGVGDGRVHHGAPMLARIVGGGASEKREAIRAIARTEGSVTAVPEDHLDPSHGVDRSGGTHHFGPF